MEANKRAVSIRNGYCPLAPLIFSLKVHVPLSRRVVDETTRDIDSSLILTVKFKA